MDDSKGIKDVTHYILGALRSFTNHTRIFSMRQTRLPSLIRSDPRLSNLCRVYNKYERLNKLVTLLNLLNKKVLRVGLIGLYLYIK